MTVSTVKRLIEEIKRLPGLTHKQAEKLVYAVLSDGSLLDIVDGFVQSARSVSRCSTCGWFVESGEQCENCSHHASVICVVPTFSDMFVVRRTGVFSGSYHILGGLVSPLENILPEDLMITALAERASDVSVKEVILAFPDSVEAEATVHYIADALFDIDVIISRFSRGISSGAKIEYADMRTVSLAFNERKPI